MTDAPHSALYFTPSRDHWHSRAQLARCVHDWGLEACHDVLDVGCGKGHWSRALAPHLPALTKLVGLDAEPAWVEAVVPAWRVSGITAQLESVRGDAHALPFVDESFDLVTCQTVLIHVRDEPRVLFEMKRVLKPGGKVLLCEPNNLANVMVELAADITLDIESVLTVLRYHLFCQRGKHALGLGDNSFGERMLGALTHAGFSLVGARQVERVHPCVPPYATDEERQQLAEQRELLDQGIAGWPRDEARRYYQASVGTDLGFDALYEQVLRYERSVLERVDAGTYARAGGLVQYLVCATK